MKIGKVLVSKHKSAVLFCVGKGLKTPVQVAKETGIQLSHVSKALSDLEKLGLVRCQTPKLRKGRIYTLADDGNTITSTLEKTKK